MYIKTAEYILKDRINMNATIVRVSNRPERPRGKKKPKLTHLQGLRMVLGFGPFKKCWHL